MLLDINKIKDDIITKLIDDLTSVATSDQQKKLMKIELEGKRKNNLLIQQSHSASFSLHLLHEMFYILSHQQVLYTHFEEGCSLPLIYASSHQELLDSRFRYKNENLLCIELLN